MAFSNYYLMVKLDHVVIFIFIFFYHNLSFETIAQLNQYLYYALSMLSKLNKLLLGFFVE
jgi:hypothetical protein